jgi:hypothetical protein
VNIDVIGFGVPAAVLVPGGLQVTGNFPTTTCPLTLFLNTGPSEYFAHSSLPCSKIIRTAKGEYLVVRGEIKPRPLDL